MTLRVKKQNKQTNEKNTLAAMLKTNCGDTKAKTWR